MKITNLDYYIEFIVCFYKDFHYDNCAPIYPIYQYKAGAYLAIIKKYYKTWRSLSHWLFNCFVLRFIQ